MNVLLVDDEIRMLDLLELYLEHYLCTKAATGKEALDLIKMRHFDLVILDIMMPEMDGRMDGLPRDPKIDKRSDYHAHR